MAIFSCSSCAITHQVPDRYLHKKVRCPSCSELITIMAHTPEAETPATTPATQQDEAAVQTSGEATPRAPRKKTGGSPDMPPIQCIDEETPREQPTPPPAPVPHQEQEQTPSELPPVQAASEQLSTPLSARNALTSQILPGIEAGILLLFLSLCIGLLLHTAAPAIATIGTFFGIALTTSIVMCFLLSSTPRLPLTVTGPETASLAILYLFAMQVNAQVGALPSFTPEQGLATLLAGSFCTAALAGCFALLAGRLDAGSALRFIPQPAMRGLLAGIGCIWLHAALQSHTLLPVAEKSFFITSLFSGFTKAMPLPELFFSLLPALLLALALTILFSRRGNPLLGITTLVLAAGCSYVSSSLFSSPPKMLHTAQASLNTMLPAVSTATPLDVWTTLSVSTIRWDILAAHLHYLAGAAVLLLLSLADKLFFLETIHPRELNISAVLSRLGMANIVSSLLCGFPGSIALSNITFTATSGSFRTAQKALLQSQPRQRHAAATTLDAAKPDSTIRHIAGMISGTLCFVMLMWGETLIPWIPRFLPAGFLLFLGLSLIRKGLVDTYNDNISANDYSLLLGVFAITIMLGPLAGLTATFGLSLLFTARRYGKSSIVKQQLSGTTHRSRVDRNDRQLAFLREHGSAIYAIRLQGYLFLGQFYEVHRLIHARLAATEEQKLRYCILDFSRISGMDSQLAASFHKLKELALSEGFTLLFTNLPFDAEITIEDESCQGEAQQAQSCSFMDLDYAFEWCEDKLLAEKAVQGSSDTLKDLLQTTFPEPELLPELFEVMEQCTFPKGRAIFAQGDPADALYFIDSGTVSIELTVDDSKTTRLKKMGAGTVIGEMGLYMDSPRSAAAVPEEEVVLYRLSQSALKNIQHASPQLYAAINRFIVHLLATRVAEANNRIRHLLQ